MICLIVNHIDATIRLELLSNYNIAVTKHYVTSTKLSDSHQNIGILLEVVYGDILVTSVFMR